MGVYCSRCKCNVTVEQDGKSCSNCSMILVGPLTGNTPKRKPKRQPDETLPAPRDAIADEQEAAATTQDQADNARAYAQDAADLQRTQQPPVDPELAAQLDRDRERAAKPKRGVVERLRGKE